MRIQSAIAGRLAHLLVAPGERTAPGHEPASIESMKMEIPRIAEPAGAVKEIYFSQGEFAQEGDVIMERAAA